MSMSTNIHLNSASEVEFGASKLLDSSTKELICYTLDLKCENGQVTSFMTLEQMQELSETINNFLHPITGHCKLDDCAMGNGDICCSDCPIKNGCQSKCDMYKKVCGEYVE